MPVRAAITGTVLMVIVSTKCLGTRVVIRDLSTRHSSGSGGVQFNRVGSPQGVCVGVIQILLTPC